MFPCAWLTIQNCLCTTWEPTSYLRMTLLLESQIVTFRGCSRKSQRSQIIKLLNMIGNQLRGIGKWCIQLLVQKKWLRPLCETLYTGQGKTEWWPDLIFGARISTFNFLPHLQSFVTWWQSNFGRREAPQITIYPYHTLVGHSSTKAYSSTLSDALRKIVSVP
jgi:hypothetical protein